tara:strand:- start:32646 stop:33416 length:771 start_codon:yes stop_codon:yes gene_type:complete
VYLLKQEFLEKNPDFVTLDCFRNRYAHITLHALSGESFPYIQNSKNLIWRDLKERFFLDEIKSFESSVFQNIAIGGGNGEKQKINKRPSCCQLMEEHFNKAVFNGTKPKLPHLKPGFVLIYIDSNPLPVAVKKGWQPNAAGENSILALQNVYDPGSGKMALIKGAVYFSPKFHRSNAKRFEALEESHVLKMKLGHNEKLAMIPARFMEPRFLGFTWNRELELLSYRRLYSLDSFQKSWLNLLQSIDAFALKYSLEK